MDTSLINILDSTAVPIILNNTLGYIFELDIPMVHFGEAMSQVELHTRRLGPIFRPLRVCQNLNLPKF